MKENISRHEPGDVGDLHTGLRNLVGPYVQNRIDYSVAYSWKPNSEEVVETGKSGVIRGIGIESEVVYLVDKTHMEPPSAEIIISPGAYEISESHTFRPGTYNGKDIGSTRLEEFTIVKE